MIDVVIPLGKQSPFKNNEVRYCLRAIEKYLKNYRNVYIIGIKPDWMQNVIHIPAVDTSGHEVNIMRKLLLACDTPEVSENFIMFNDDHFLLKPVDATSYPYYFCEDLTRRVIGSSYKESCTNTRNALERNGYNIKHYDIHCPIIYNKFAFKQTMAMYDWTIQNGYIIKSLYCNSMQVVGEEMKDCKLIRKYDTLSLQTELLGRHVFSCGDNGWASAEAYLKQLNKSKYEC